MVASNDGSRLVQIKAIDENYPFYGAVKLKSGGTISSVGQEPLMWVYPELLPELHLTVGDQVNLGDQKFRIQDVIIDDSSQSFGFASIAPKVYVGLPWMLKSSLISRGATVRDTRRYYFLSQEKNQILSDYELEKIKKNLPMCSGRWNRERHRSLSC